MTDMLRAANGKDNASVLNQKFSKVKIPETAPQTAQVAPEGYVDSGKKFIFRFPAGTLPDKDGYVKIRVGDWNSTWQKHGLYTTPMFLAQKDAAKNLGQATGGLINVLGSDYVLWPNEEVEQIMEEFSDENGFEQYHGHGGAYTKTTSNGNGVILCYLPKGDYYGSAFAEKQELKTGFSVRNSVDGSMGFGLDSFTYRGLCWNGMIRGRKDTTNEYRHHVGSFMDYVKDLGRHIQDVMEVGKNLLSYYEQLSKIELNTKYAEILSNTRLPRNALPWEFTEPQKDATEQVKKEFQPKPILTGDFKLSDREGNMDFKGASMFDIFNSVTANIWHGKATINVKRWYDTTLSEAITKVAPLPVARKV